MNKLRKMTEDRFNDSIQREIENKYVHNELLDMCKQMIYDMPLLRETVLSTIVNNHKKAIDECNISIQFLQSELKEFKNKFKKVS